MTCASCKRDRPLAALGRCFPCYQRDYLKRPVPFDEDHQQSANTAEETRQIVDEELTFLNGTCQLSRTESIDRIADSLDVTTRTVERYLADSEAA